MRKKFASLSIRSCSFSRGFSTYNPFIFFPAAKNVSSDLQQAFEGLSSEIAQHRAFAHPLFDYMRETPISKGLTPEQFARFRGGMFRRIFPTIGYVGALTAKAAVTGDRKALVTASRNLLEETGGAKKIEGLHPVLCEEAFNAMASRIFKLNPLWMHDAVKINPHPKNLTQTYTFRLPEEVYYYAITSYVYDRFPELASWVSESASGGDNQKRKGMMGDLFGVFSAYQTAFPEGEFDRHVLPYFREHVSLKQEKNGSYTVIFDGSGVELQHALRAKEDAMATFSTPEELQQVRPYIDAFANAQGHLFDAILKDVEAARNIGEPVRAPVLVDPNTPIESLAVIEPKRHVMPPKKEPQTLSKEYASERPALTR